jgi:hypothetical protein
MRDNHLRSADFFEAERCRHRPGRPGIPRCLSGNTCKHCTPATAPSSSSSHTRAASSRPPVLCQPATRRSAIAALGKTLPSHRADVLPTGSYLLEPAGFRPGNPGSWQPYRYLHS